MTNKKKNKPRFGFPNFIINNDNNKIKYEISNNNVDIYDILSKKKTPTKNIRDIKVIEEELEII